MTVAPCQVLLERMHILSKISLCNQDHLVLTRALTYVCPSIACTLDWLGRPRSPGVEVVLRHADIELLPERQGEGQLLDLQQHWF